jgi:hypothetical protein
VLGQATLLRVRDEMVESEFGYRHLNRSTRIIYHLSFFIWSFVIYEVSTTTGGVVTDLLNAQMKNDK